MDMILYSLFLEVQVKRVCLALKFQSLAFYLARINTTEWSVYIQQPTKQSYQSTTAYFSNRQHWMDDARRQT